MNKSTFHILIAFTIIFILFNYNVLSAANENDENAKTKLLSTFRNSKSDTAKISALFHLAKIYSEIHADPFKADSLSQFAINIAELSYNDELKLNTYNLYFETNDLNLFTKKGGNLLAKMEEILSHVKDPQVIWRSYQNIAHYYYENRMYDNALNFSYKAFTYASVNENEFNKARSYLSIGKNLAAKKRNVEAFRNFGSALTIAEKLNGRTLLIECHHVLSDFYRFNKLFNKAMLYKHKELDLVRALEPLDSTALMWVHSDFEEIGIGGNGNKVNGQIIRHVLNYAKRNNNDKLRFVISSIYRTHLIKENKLDEMHSFYKQEYPEELEHIKNTDYTMYVRLLGFIYEVENNIDSAYYCYEKAAQLIEIHTSPLMKSNFYKRYAQFLQRQNNPDEAIDKYNLSLKLARKGNYIPFALDASTQLEQLYAQKDDFNNAYKYLSITRSTGR